MPGPIGAPGGLLEMAQEQAPPPDTSLHFVGLPPGFMGQFNAVNGMGAPGGSPMGGAPGGAPGLSPFESAYSDPSKWGLTLQDRENPLAYTGPDWQPRDTGGFFSLGQLYDFAQGGARAQPNLAFGGAPMDPRGPRRVNQNAAPGQNVPWMFQQGADLPSTNNWTMLPDPYRSPQFIMRNGHVIDMNSAGRRAKSWGEGAGAWLPANFNNVGNQQGEYPISGTTYPDFGEPGGLRGYLSYWPGQLENARPHAWPGSSV